jgi:preprotein translocase subunit SecF
VVFDKIRENTHEDESSSSRTFAASVNLAVNQTLVRSINTSVVAALPVASILFIGAFVLGAGTLRDISLALLIGILVGTYSTIFIAAPLYAHLREGEPAIRKHDKRVLAARSKAAERADEVTV